VIGQLQINADFAINEPTVEYAAVACGRSRTGNPVTKFSRCKFSSWQDLTLDLVYTLMEVTGRNILSSIIISAITIS